MHIASDENETDMDVSKQKEKSKIHQLSRITVEKSPKIPQMSKPVSRLLLQLKLLPSIYCYSFCFTKYDGNIIFSRFGVNNVDEIALSKVSRNKIRLLDGFYNG